MECLSSYYTMELYEDGVILYVSGGAAYTETFIQFQEEAESWQQVACIAVDWDYVYAVVSKNSVKSATL